ncbi:MAG: ATP-binding protein [Sulfolobaceae archaeon]
MLFDPSTKLRREDFFDRAEEIDRIKSLLSPIILVLGLRRTGKSSIIRIALNELNYPYIYLDLRKFEERSYINYKDFIIEIQSEVNKLIKKFPEILDFIKKIRGVKILGNEILFSWGKERVSFTSLLESLNDWASDRKIIVVLDEAQELIKMRGANLLTPLAYSFDNLKKLELYSAVPKWAYSIAS